MPTTNPVPSQDPSDLLFNAGKLDEVVSGSNATYTDRLGVSRRTMAGVDAAADVVLGGLGYAPPVAYAAGIALTLTTQTVEYAGEVYAPKVVNLPFTTSGTFETAKFRLIQGVASVDLESGGGAAMVGYTPAGTGAVATTVQSKLRETVSVKEFGAVGDGAADDTAAIQAAIDTGKDVIFPDASYKITAPLQVGSQRLKGGVGSKWINRSQSRLVIPGNHAGFTNKAGYPSFSIDGFYIYYGDVTPTNSSTDGNKIGFYFTTVGGGSPEIVQINNCTVRGSWWTYFDNTGTYLSKLTSVIGRNTKNGFRKSGGTTILFDTCATADGTTGFYLDNILSPTLINCACDLLNVSTTQSAAASGNLFVSCQSLVINGWDAESNSMNTDSGGGDAALFRFQDTVGTITGFFGYLSSFQTSGAGSSAGVNLFKAENNSRITIIGSQDVFTGAIPYTGTGGYPATLQTDSTSWISVYGSQFGAATGGSPAVSTVATGNNITFTNSLIAGNNTGYAETKSSGESSVTTNGSRRYTLTQAGLHGFGTSTPYQTVHVGGAAAINGSASIHSGVAVLTGTFASLPTGNSVQIDVDLKSDCTFVIEVTAKGVNSSNGQNAAAQAVVKGSKIGNDVYDSAVSALYLNRFSTPTVAHVSGTNRILITIPNANGQTFDSHNAFMLRVFGSDQASVNNVSIV